MKDYRIEIKVKNNLLYKKIMDSGYESLADFARKIKISNTVLCSYVSLQDKPIKKNGEWSKTWLKISDTLKSLPEDLCPAKHLRDALKTNRAVVEASFEDMQYLIPPKSPDNIFIESKMREEINKAISKLPNRTREILEHRFGLNGKEEMSLRDLGLKYNVSSPRIRSLEQKAVRILRSPKNSKVLKQFIEN